MNIQNKAKILTLCGIIILGGMLFAGIDTVTAAWSGGSYSCSTSHICYDGYGCSNPSTWDYDRNRRCPGRTINCDNYSDCGSRIDNGTSLYYICGYDSTSCSDTRYCTFATGVASWSACSATGTQWATAYTYNTWYGTTSCSDYSFPTTRSCIPPAPTLNLTTSKAIVNPGESFNLSWATTNATSCTASNAWSGSKNSGGGNEPQTANSTATYGLECWSLTGVSSGPKTATICVKNCSGAANYCGDYDGGCGMSNTCAGTKIPDCTKASTICSGVKYGNGCSGDTDSCTGTKIETNCSSNTCIGSTCAYCDASGSHSVGGAKDCRDNNWKEVSPE